MSQDRAARETRRSWPKPQVLLGAAGDQEEVEATDWTGNVANSVPKTSVLGTPRCDLQAGAIPSQTIASLVRSVRGPTFAASFTPCDTLKHSARYSQELNHGDTEPVAATGGVCLKLMFSARRSRP
jgi:hypothetical protein